MNSFLWNIAMALIWAAAVGSFAPLDLLLGFALGYLMLAATSRRARSRRYVRRVPQVGRLVGLFLTELLVANFRVAWDVITPHPRMRPAIVAMPLEAKSDLELLLLTTMITLTPGSLAVEVSKDRGTLYVHGMHVADPDDFRRKLRDTFERNLLEVTR